MGCICASGPVATWQLTCSWHQKNETKNSPIHQLMNLKCCIKARELLKPLFNGVLFLIYYFRKHFKPSFFILKAFCSTLKSWIGEFVVSFFDVTNRLNNELTWHYRYLSEGIKRNPFHFIGTLKWGLTQRMKNLICLSFLLQATFGFQSKLKFLLQLNINNIQLMKEAL